MTDTRAFIDQGLQWAKQTGMGTPATTGFRTIGGLAITPGIQMPRTEFRATGRRFAQLVPRGREWTQAGLTGPVCYDEVIYPLSMVFGPSTATQQGTISVWTHHWAPPVKGTITPVPFTIQMGESGANLGMEFSDAYMPEWGYDFARDGAATQTGTIMGSKLLPTTTVNASPTDVPLIDLNTEDINVYANDTAAALGTTLVDAASVSFRAANMHSPYWSFNRAKPGFSKIVNAVPNNEFRMTLEANDAGKAFITASRNRQKKFFRVEAIDQGPAAGGTIPYSFIHDLCTEVRNISDFRNTQEVLGYEVTFAIIEERAWPGGSKAMTLDVTNTTAAL